MSTKVYWMRQSVDDNDERPDGVTYRDPNGWFKTAEGFKDFQSNAFVSAGDPAYPPERWFVPDLYASRKGNTPVEEWDYYMCSGTFGAFSQRAMDKLSVAFSDRFLPLSVNLEEHSYYSLRCQRRIDCLDRAASRIDFFENDQQKVLQITKHVFHQEWLTGSMIFAIPELDFELFCTDSIPELADKAGLRGFEFELVDEGRE